MDGCKDALLLLHLFEDNENDGGLKKQFDICLPIHLNITGIVSCQASSRRDPTHPKYSEQGGQNLHAQEEHNMLLDVVDYEIDVYEAAMCNPSNGGTDAFFCLEHSGKAASVPHDKVYLFFPFFHSVKMRLISCRQFFFSYFFSIR